MTAWICVKIRNRDLESGFKCMEHRLGLVVVPILFDCLNVHAHSDTLECTHSVQTDD